MKKEGLYLALFLLILIGSTYLTGNILKNKSEPYTPERNNILLQTPIIVECNDGIDNDNDGLIDATYDLGCYDYSDNTERGLRTHSNLVGIAPTTLEDEDGWFTFDPSSNTRIVYVSSTIGNDSYDGLCPEVAGACGPKRTITAGKSLMRLNRADWLLLRRGDIFQEETIDPNPQMNGLSNNEPSIIGAYGNLSLERPIIDSNTNTRCFYSGMRNNFVVQDIECLGNAHERNQWGPTAAIYFIGGPNTSENITIQGVKMTGYAAGLIFDGSTSNFSFVEINRITIHDNWDNQSNRQTIYTANTRNVTLREVTFDETAWNSSDLSTRSFLDHLYYQNQADLGVVNVMGSLFSRGPDSQFRYGAILRNNHWVNTTHGPMLSRVPDIPIILEDNVVMLGDPAMIYNGFVLGQQHARFGEGLHINGVPGTTSQAIFRNNIFARKQPSIEDSYGVGIAISPDNNGQINNLLVENNIIYDWNNQAFSVRTISSGENNTIRNNIIQEPYANLRIYPCTHCGLMSASNTSLNRITLQGNKYYSTSNDPQFALDQVGINFTTWKTNIEPTAIQEKAEFVDPNRTTETYATSLGYQNLDSFLDDVVEERRGRWNNNLHAPAINNYIRGGFTLLSQTCSNNMSQSCLNQNGVCFSSTQTCTNNVWPGCDYSNIPNYQNVETSCDSLDNDCDGTTDEGCNPTSTGTTTSSGSGSGGSSGGSGGSSGGIGSSSGGSSGSVIFYQCSDGLDNDGDNMIDYPQDAGCSNAQDNVELDGDPLETNELIESTEENLLDNLSKKVQIGFVFWTILAVLILGILTIGIIIARNRQKLKSYIIQGNNNQLIQSK